MRMRAFVTLCLATSPAFAAMPDDAKLLDRMGAADTNGDGAITRPELLNYRAANFARLDRNGDGSLMKSDIPAFLAGRGRPLDFDALIGQFDANRDGKVSRAEFVNGPTLAFDTADANRDGQLTAAERQAAIARARSARR